jgi:hypothetical protein
VGYGDRQNAGKDAEVAAVSFLDWVPLSPLGLTESEPRAFKAQVGHSVAE